MAKKARERKPTLHLSLRTCIVASTDRRRCIRTHPRFRLGRFGSPAYPILLLQDRVEVTACSATPEGEGGGHRFARVDLERGGASQYGRAGAAFRGKGRKGAWSHEIDDGARSNGFQVLDERARVSAISRRSIDTLCRVIIEFLCHHRILVSTTDMAASLKERIAMGRDSP